MTSSQSPVISCADRAPVSTCVLEAIARAEEIDALDIQRPLYEVVDPDALDTLYGTDESGPTVEFTYCGYSVTVRADGEVSVRELTD